MTQPCLLVASAPQIDLQAFIKAASGYAGQRLLDGQLRVCVCVCVCECEYVFVGLCDCVCLRLGSRLLPEVEFHRPAVSLQLQSNRTATQSAALQKAFSSVLLTAFVHLPSSSFFSLSWLQLEW